MRNKSIIQNIIQGDCGCGVPAKTKIIALPALVIELKWDKPSEGAIRQIKEKDYPAILKDHGGEIVLTGISYDVKKKVHSCVIERV